GEPVHVLDPRPACWCHAAHPRAPAPRRAQVRLARWPADADLEGGTTVQQLSAFWDRVAAATPDLSRGILLGAAAVAALLVLVPSLWRVTRHAVTIAHEGAHG